MRVPSSPSYRRTLPRGQSHPSGGRRCGTRPPFSFRAMQGGLGRSQDGGGVAVAAALSGAVWRERGRRSPDLFLLVLLLLLVLFFGVIIPEGSGKRGRGKCCPSGSGRVGAVQRGTASPHAIIARPVLRTLQCSSLVFLQLVRLEGIVKNRWLGFGGRLLGEFLVLKDSKLASYNVK